MFQVEARKKSYTQGIGHMLKLRNGFLSSAHRFLIGNKIQGLGFEGPPKQGSQRSVGTPGNFGGNAWESVEKRPWLGKSNLNHKP